MKINLVQIGNSKGIRIPKTLIEQFHLHDEIEIVPSRRGLLIKSVAKPRSKWGDLFKASILSSGKENENPEWKNIPNRFDKDEWSW